MTQTPGVKVAAGCILAMFALAVVTALAVTLAIIAVAVRVIQG